MLLCGELNKNLKQIEKALKIKVTQNGTEFNISGNQDDVEMGVTALFDLKQKLETNSVITPDLIHLSLHTCLLYTSPSPRDMRRSRMPSSA